MDSPTMQFEGDFQFPFSAKMQAVRDMIQQDHLFVWGLVCLFNGYEPLIQSGLYGPWSARTATYFRTRLPKSMGGDRSEAKGQRNLQKTFMEIRWWLGSDFLNRLKQEIEPHVRSPD